MTLKFDGWPSKTIGHLFYATSSFVQHFVAIGEFKLELQSGNAQSGSNSTILRAVWPFWNFWGIWKLRPAYRRMTSLLCCFKLNSNWIGHLFWAVLTFCIIKLYASSHHHMWIQTGVTVRKWWSWVVTSVTLTFDLWSWPFAWTPLLSLVITPENFMMIRWWEHSQKGVTDRQTYGQTDGRTDWTIHRAAWSQLKNTSKILKRKFAKITVSNKTFPKYNQVITMTRAIKMKMARRRSQ